MCTRIITAFVCTFVTNCDVEHIFLDDQHNYVVDYDCSRIPDKMVYYDCSRIQDEKGNYDLGGIQDKMG